VIRFVTGSDVGVGKTVVAAVMARADQRAGHSVGYLKPVQTGIPKDASGDADFVHAAAGVPAHEALRFSLKLDPAVAADQAAVTVGLDWLVNLARAHASGVEVLYVEGTGGLLSPLTGELTMADLAMQLGADLIVVTRVGPGTLSQVALTLEAARRRSLQVLGLVVNQWPRNPGVLEQANLDRLRRIAPVLGLLAAREGLDTSRLPAKPLDLELAPPT